MERPRILLTGRNGQVGWELCRTLAPVGQLVPFGAAELDLTDSAAVRQCIANVAPSVVVNAAAYTHVDKAENEPELARQINGVAPGILAEAAKEIGALLIHYSTDYVFDGTKSCPYEEHDAPNPLGVYGRSKLAGEEAIQRAGGDYVIFRLEWVYGARGRNFLRTIRRLARERERLRVVSDQFGAPTWSRAIGEATALAVHQLLRERDIGRFKGIYHLSATGSTSWHGFAERIVAEMPALERKCRQVEAIATVEFHTAARRPRNSVMSCDKLERTFGLRLPHWEESFKTMLEGWDGAI